jgi:hypothetical protein
MGNEHLEEIIGDAFLAKDIISRHNSSVLLFISSRVFSGSLRLKCLKNKNVGKYE